MAAIEAASEFEEERFGHSTVLYGANHGKYPHGNSLLVRGTAERLIIDPSLGVVARHAASGASALPQVDRVWNSHCHEDHVAGNHLFPAAAWALHEADAQGLRSFEGLLAIYGYDDSVLGPGFEASLYSQFHYQARADVGSFVDGHVLELGGGVRVRVIHTPGHTRGHCAFHVEPDDVLYIGDIDLTSFGPYYGDAWSDLVAFEQSLRLLRTIRAHRYVTFHHIGTVDHEQFLARLDKFEAVIATREQRLLAFLRDAPRSIEDIVAHRFVYRPGDAVVFADPVERRSMTQHLQRLCAAGAVREVEEGRFLAA